MRYKGIDTSDGTRGACARGVLVTIAPLTIKKTSLPLQSKGVGLLRTAGLTALESRSVGISAEKSSTRRSGVVLKLT